ncbi:unnamed protein product [Prunus armeniaca]|uniref:Uncharacterized protein n=1 Tax=Prunus armeniaca TaxID=36596 RepID=A0A6J5TIH4_PRUAR|nr:unnamed protein product [Prunus armeniaca]CAB4263750.1 unnamed protein product [Prunus armeniaca]CAB4294324.1 unnamed protein product [Prunus armeniaca]CAB4294362.1 unnamed protein product [Prunus armeniaca]
MLKRKGSVALDYLSRTLVGADTKAQTLSPGTSRSAHIESRSAQVFILEPFLKDVSLYNKP